MKALPLRLLACALAAVLPLAACGGKEGKARNDKASPSGSSGSDGKPGAETSKAPVPGVDVPLPPAAGMPAPGGDPYAPIPPLPLPVPPPGDAASKLTQANFEKVVAGMDPAKVKEILGDPNETRELPNPAAGSRQTVFLYRAGGSSEARIVFTDGKVSEKSGSLPR